MVIVELMETGGETMRFNRYEDARAYAVWNSKDSGFDVAIRHVKEWGRDGFNVSYAAKNDSDYAKAEIVRPDAQV